MHNTESGVIGQRLTMVIGAAIRHPAHRMSLRTLALRSGRPYNSFRERYNAGRLDIDDLEAIAPVLDLEPEALVECARKGDFPYADSDPTATETQLRLFRHLSAVPALN